MCYPNRITIQSHTHTPTLSEKKAFANAHSKPISMYGNVFIFILLLLRIRCARIPRSYAIRQRLYQRRYGDRRCRRQRRQHQHQQRRGRHRVDGRKAAAAYANISILSATTYDLFSVVVSVVGVGGHRHRSRCRRHRCCAACCSRFRPLAQCVRQASLQLRVVVIDGVDRIVDGRRWRR